MLKNFRNLLVCISLFSPALFAKSLFIHSSVSLSQSRALWLRGDDKTDYQGAGLLEGGANQATRRYYQGSLNGTLNLNPEWEFYMGFRYGHVKLSDGPFLGAKQDETRSQLSEASIGAGYNFYTDSNKLIGVFLKYIHPGQTKRVKPAFLSFNDFGAHLELGVHGSFFFKTWELHPLVKFKQKVAGLGNHHIAFENKLFYNFTKKFKLGPGIDYLTTLGGRDVADAAFVDYRVKSSWFPVWNKKEKWLGLSAIGAYRIKKDLIFDFYIHRKLWGENTDVSSTIGLGIGKGIDL